MSENAAYSTVRMELSGPHDLVGGDLQPCPIYETIDCNPSQLVPTNRTTNKYITTTLPPDCNCSGQ